MKNINLIFLIALLFASCQPQNDNKTEVVSQEAPPARPLAKFEPPAGKCLVFAGQELESIGGLEAPYNDGYFDHFEAPAGFTMYSTWRPGDESFGHTYKGNDGIFTTDDWGDSPSNMSMQLADPDFKTCALAIGMELRYHLEKIVAGEHDKLIEDFGKFALSLGKRPIFLRIGYEFDGHAWNFYEKEAYKKAYRRIKDNLDAQGVENIAYVWQSTGWVTPLDLLEEWYPGDTYVDWCGYSFFARWSEAVMNEFARKKGKPVFIAEATPTISSHTVKFDGITRETVLSNPEQAQQAWDMWFKPFFKTIHEEEDVVKAISYINCHWKSHPMWKENPTFKNIDARLQTSQMISKKWKDEMSKDKYLQAADDFYGLTEN